MRYRYSLLLSLIVAMFSGFAQETVQLDKAVYLDKCNGAWAGQMIGVCRGAPFEFGSNGKPMLDTIPPWDPKQIEGAIGQDDLYVEMTFLKALEDYGQDISFEQAGKAFADSKYPLWHANLYGRENVRRGIMPPLSGHPLFNRHADDIDFQIEADLFGIVAPGLPLESNRLCEVFGHVMNYGDGVYGGMFVAGMYAAAYLEDTDVRKVLDAGLACIPADSQYAACIRDVLQWHDENPGDWLAAWKKIEEKWNDDVDCIPGSPFNIDAKLNGAYIAMGLLYGDGDILNSCEIGIRCGQDSDCNPSNAAGVLGCMKGYSHIPEELTKGIPAMADTNFSFTSYSFNTLSEATRRVAEAVILHAGGAVGAEAYTLPAQAPAPPVTFEQWADQRAILSTPISAAEMKLWSPGWKVAACGTDMEPGIHQHQYGRDLVLVLHPVSETVPGAIEAALAIPSGAKRLVATVASHQGDELYDYVLRIFVNGEKVAEKTIATNGKWVDVSADISKWAGTTAHVRIEDVANGWSCEAAYIASIEIG